MRHLAILLVLALFAGLAAAEEPELPRYLVFDYACESNLYFNGTVDLNNSVYLSWNPDEYRTYFNVDPCKWSVHPVADIEALLGWFKANVMCASAEFQRIYDLERGKWVAVECEPVEVEVTENQWSLAD